jgi:alkylation response protein AidB-like acyl-CoA dehydrogenase
MDFSLSDEQVALRETVRRFAQAELVPLAAELERDNRPVPRDMVRRYAEMGLLASTRPKRWVVWGSPIWTH